MNWRLADLSCRPVISIAVTSCDNNKLSIVIFYSTEMKLTDQDRKLEVSNQFRILNRSG